MDTKLDTITAALFGVPVEALYSQSLKRSITLPRQVCMTISHKIYRQRLWQVKNKYGLRNHATLIHGRKTVQGMYMSSKEFRSKLNTLLAELDIDLSMAIEEIGLKGGANG